LDHTVFVVDDDESARKSLTFLLRTDGLRSRAFGSAPAFLEQLTADQRGCVVTDVRMPQMDGIALFRRLRELDCRMPVIVITGHAEVPMAVQAMKAGACDFIEKPFESEVILQAVRRCLEKSRSLCTVDANRAAIEERLASLTMREHQVFMAVAAGKSNKDVALELKISPRTVEAHRSRMMSKMQAASVSDLVQMKLTAATA
jgi:two-component system, LuxR family, response regulator FixJ